MPRYIVLGAFAQLALYDLEPEGQRAPSLFNKDRAYCPTGFPLAEPPRQAQDFASIKREKSARLDPEGPANLKATQLLTDPHDASRPLTTPATFSNASSSPPLLSLRREFRHPSPGCHRGATIVLTPTNLAQNNSS